MAHPTEQPELFRQFGSVPAGAGSLRPAPGEGRLRPGHGRDPARHGRPRHRDAGARRPAAPRAPRRGRIGCRNRRRGRHRHADPGRVPARRRRVRAAAGRPVRRRHGLPARSTRTRAPRSRRASRSSRSRRACGFSAGARCPTDPSHLGALAREAMPVFEQLFVDLAAHRTRTASRCPGILLDRQTFRLRKRAERDSGRLLPVALGAHPGLQGHGHDAPARAVLPRPERRALRLEARARALALLDQHLPVLAARPAVPDDRAQRRDQHGAGQPQLDARPPEPARVASCSATCARCSRSSARARATRRRSTRSSSC